MVDSGIWKPNKKQSEFLAVPSSIKEAAYLGGAGSGKSDVLLVYGIVNRWHQNPKFKQVFMRRTYPELRNEIVPRSREIYRKFGAEFNKSTMCWSFPRPDQIGGRGLANEGAMIMLGHCETDEDVHKYDSMEINLYTPDEITSYSEFIYLYIGFTRVRTSDPELPAIIRSAGMPGGVGHTWVKKRFVDPAVKGSTIIKGRGGNKRIYIFATQADNPHIDPNYAQSLQALPEAEKRAKLYGDFNAYLGQVFEEFRDRHYPDEPDNALHMIEPFDIPEWWPKIVAIDWGYTALTYAVWGAVSPTKRLYVYREQYWRKTKIEEWASEIKEFVDLEKPRVIKLCQSAGQDRGQEHTIQRQVSDALGRQIELTHNDPGTRVAGKALIHEYLRWHPRRIPTHEITIYREEYAQWLLRNKGIDEFKAYLKQFETPKAEENLPKMQIFKTVTLLPETIKACTYDKTRIEDVAEFQDDDPYDALRYLVDTAERFFTVSEKEFDKVQKREELVQYLKENNDWTMFYRNARALDSKNYNAPVMRYHRRKVM